MSKELTKEELQSVIRDSVKAELAASMIESQRQVEENFKKLAMDQKVDVGRMIREEMERDRNGRGAQGDRERGIVTNDPFKGKGVDFARWVRCIHEAGQKGDPKAVAKRHADAGVPGYKEMLERGLLESNYTSAGFLVPTSVSNEFIELLYAMTVCLELGARTLPFQGSMEMGKQNQGATVYYVGEAANITPSTPSGGALNFKRKMAAALIPVSNWLLRNPSVGADTFLRDDLLKAIALKRDLSMLRGPGTEFQPKGVKGWVNSANSNGQSGTALANKVADLIKAISLVDGGDVQLLRPGFAMNPRTKWSLAATLDSNGNHVFWAMIASGQLYGFPLRTTTQIPKNLGGGGNESEIYFGAWQELILGLETDLTVELFANGTFYDGSTLVSGISTDQSVLRALEGHDVVVRHDLAFSMVTGVTWT